jgi:TIR domain
MATSDASSQLPQAVSALSPRNLTQGSLDDKVRVFISHASSDNGIATALYEELTEIDRNRVECFLDTQTIESGKDWTKLLNDALATADWLFCIYTGDQSEFCGFEIGVFTTVHQSERDSQDDRLVCLHDVATIPAVFHSHQNRLVAFPPKTGASGEQFDEAAFYLGSQVAKFLTDFYKYKGLYVARDAAASQRQLQTLIRQTKRITEAFKAARASDIQSDTPTQLGVDIFVSANPSAERTRIPDDAEVTGTFQSLGLFGLMPPMQNQRLPTATWSRVREACSTAFRTTALWMERLEKDMVDAANGRALSGLEATLSSKDKVYRTILARHAIYENGSHKFSVLFVETLPRQFLGKQHTSLILAGLILASRFRFAYFEEPETIATKFGDTLSDQEFATNVWQLDYDLDRWRHEAMEFGLLDPVAFVKAFGDERKAFAEALLKTSSDSRDRLIARLPTLGEEIGPKNRADIKRAILDYFDTVEPVNRQFLTVALDVYRDAMLSELTKIRLSPK